LAEGKLAWPAATLTARMPPIISKS